MERQYVGIDLHRRRSVIYQMDEGEAHAVARAVTQSSLVFLSQPGEALPSGANRWP